MRIGRYAALTDTGRRRIQNEDTHVAEPPLFGVADGMGGARAGEVASSLATDALESWRADERDEPAVAGIIRDANARIFERSSGDPASSGMGTTLTVAIVDKRVETLAIGHVGDSRAYRIRDGRMDQLTSDHSLVAELLRAGRLTAEEAENHPHRSVITRALGTEPNVEVDTVTVALKPGDLYLLCSDGLTAMIRDDEILAVVVSAGRDPRGAAEMLVRAANDAGGEDNITVVLFEISDGDPPAPAGSAERPYPEVAHDEPATAERRPPESPTRPVRRWGASAGSRWPPLLLIVTTLVIAAAFISWGVLR